MKKIKIFLTGESGMLSTAIIKSKHLIENHFDIIDFSCFATYTNCFHFLNKIQVKASEVDFTDVGVLNLISNEISQLKDDGYDVWIIHTGAYVNTDKCEQYSYEAVKSNVYGTQLLINLAKKHDCKFIYFSTTAVFDPEYYMERSNGWFDENYKINPKTIYGLTKYCGEVSTEQSINKSNYIIIKPVFIYGDAPFDNSSMIRKILEKIYLGDKSTKLDVLLSQHYLKDYMRYEGFAVLFSMLLNKAVNEKKVWGQSYIISRNDPKPFSNYLKIIFNEFNLKFSVNNDYINLIEDGDYLMSHNGVSTNLLNIFSESELNLRNKYDFLFNDKYSIQLTLKSIKEFYESAR